MSDPSVVSRRTGEFLVNSVTASGQYNPAVAPLAQGGFVVSWHDYSGQGGDTSLTGIKSQIYDAAGNKLGAEFLVNSKTAGYQSFASVTGLANGGFVIAWEDSPLVVDASHPAAIRGQIYDGTGTAVGAEFRIDAARGAEVRSPVLTSLANGGFAASWQGSDQSGYGIEAQVFDATGVRTGTAFNVNTTTAASQIAPAATSLSGGGWVVAWQDFSGRGGDASAAGIKAQILDLTGAKIGSEFLVNTATTGMQGTPSLVGLRDGGFVVAWEDASGLGGDSSGTAIKAQIFDRAGAKAGSEFLVNTATAGNQAGPTVTALPNGGFVVSWEDASGQGGDVSDTGIKAQIFRATGERVGTEFLINTVTENRQNNPALATLANGDVVIAWQDLSGQAGDASGTGIKAQILDPNVNHAGRLSLTGLSAGSAVEGQLITASVLDDDGVPSTGLTYVFTLDGQRVAANATGLYEPGYTDAGKALAVSVAYTDALGHGEALTLSAGAVRDAAPVAAKSFGFDFASAQVRIAENHTIVTGPDGVARDVTGVATLTFTDGTIREHAGSAMVDDLFYFSNNLDVWNAKLDAATHYNQYGWHEGRNPDALFSTNGYLAANRDVAASGMNPLTHYDQYGWKEGRDPSAAFDNELYLAHNPDVKAAGLDPLAHYLQYGQAEGRQAYAAIGRAADFTHGSFDAEYYLLANPDVAKAALASGGDSFAFAFQHYTINGSHEGRQANAYFDTAYYLAHNPDVSAAGLNPLAHYDQFGWKEGRDPSASFGTGAYLTANPDVATAHIDPLTHYLQFGHLEERHLA